MQDNKPYNGKGQAHGNWEVYYTNGQLHFKGLFVDDDVQGYYESYDLGGDLILKCHMFDREVYGYCKHYNEISYHAR